MDGKLVRGTLLLSTAVLFSSVATFLLGLAVGQWGVIRTVPTAPICGCALVLIVWGVVLVTSGLDVLISQEGREKKAANGLTNGEGTTPCTRPHTS